MRGWLAYMARQRTARQVEPYGRLHQLIRDFEDRQVLEFDENPAREFGGPTGLLQILPPDGVA